jgi:protein-disulfide isomerase
MKTSLKAFVGAALLFSPSIVRAQVAAPATGQTTQVQKQIESYLRNMYAFGSDVQVTVSAPKESQLAGLLETEVAVKIGDNTENAKFYVSKDGKYLVRGEIADLTRDPLADNRSKIDMKNSPAMGNANPTVTLVEYSDFECPVCRNLHAVLREMLPKYPQVRLVFKDFPLDSIHPWARTAALAGRCAYQQNPAAFWKMYDAIYDGQEIISASNAYTKMTDFAGQAGLSTSVFKSCLAGPEAAAAVDASRANGLQLEVNSTPTIFVNGRRLVGADGRTLEQYIQYELARQKTSAKN